MGKLFEIIKSKHVVATHTEKTLLENKHVKDFCEEARHFVMMDGTPPLYIHYDTASWFKQPMGVQVTIDAIGVYDNFMEYETARNKQLQGAEEKDIPNLN
jgi:hypothetical protein